MMAGQTYMQTYMQTHMTTMMKCRPTGIDVDKWFDVVVQVCPKRILVWRYNWKATYNHTALGLFILSHYTPMLSRSFCRNYIFVTDPKFATFLGIDLTNKANIFRLSTMYGSTMFGYHEDPFACPELSQRLNASGTQVVYHGGYRMEFDGSPSGQTVTCTCPRTGNVCRCAVAAIHRRITQKTGLGLSSCRKMYPDEVGEVNYELDPTVDEACMSVGIIVIHFPPFVV